MHAKKILTESHLKSTPARKEILSVMKQAKKPTDINSIINRLEEKSFSIDRVTVFRIMNKFVESGVVHKLEFSEGKARYELASLPHHHHAVCTECGSIKDIGECDLDSIEKKVKRDMNFQIKYHRLEFFGLCSRCR